MYSLFTLATRAIKNTKHRDYAIRLLCQTLPATCFSEEAINIVCAPVVKKSVEIFISDRFGSEIFVVLQTKLGKIDVKFHKKREFSVHVCVNSLETQHPIGTYLHTAVISFKKNVLKQPFLQFILSQFDPILVEYISAGMRKKWSIVKPFVHKVINLPKLEKFIEVSNTSGNYIHYKET